jgi:chromosomal replication initiator protein
MAKLETYWPEILDVVRQKVPQQTFNTWFLPLQPENSENGAYRVACPNHFFMDWFSEHHLKILNEAGSVYFGHPVVFALAVEATTSTTTQELLSSLLDETDENQQLAGEAAAGGPAVLPDGGDVPDRPEYNSPFAAATTLGLGSPEGLRSPKNLGSNETGRTPGGTSGGTSGRTSGSGPGMRATAATATRNPDLPNQGFSTNLNPDYTFENFVIGSGTELAFAAATAIAKNPGSHFNPLFIHGGTGLGKTHLMQAIGNDIKRQHPQKRVCYVTTEQFTNDLIGSIRDNRTPDFKLKYRSVDVLLVDDVAFLAGKESTQEEFFHTFNTLYDLKKQIVLTSDRSPKEITLLEERLRSRFEWGLITDIQPPNLETRIAILKRKIDVNNIYIADEVISYIADNVTDNIRRLEGALIRLLAFASLTGREMTMEMASEALFSYFQGHSTGPVKIADVMSEVADAHDMTVDQLKSKRRTQDLARARQIAMYLARELTDASLNQIGMAFGNRDHSTVSHAHKKIKAEMGKDPRFRGFVRDVQERVQKTKKK